jgi:hypothetical protein
MAVEWYKGHITHVIISFVYAIAVVALTSVEMYFLKTANSTEIFFIVVQNVGIMGTSGYFASKISVTPTGLTEANKGA